MKKQIAQNLLTILFVVATILIVNRLTHYSVNDNKVVEQSIRETLLLIFFFTSILYFAINYLLKKTK